MINASVYVICFNEEQHIARLLDNVSEFAEVILVDSGSTDNTINIASTYPNVTIYHQSWLGYARQKDYALKKCSKDWVVNLDADEILSLQLKNEIVQVVKNNDCDAFSVKFAESFLGKTTSKFSRHAHNIRIFKRGFAQYNLEHLVHEGLIVNGHTKMAKGVIYHYGLTSIESLVTKNNNYSTLKALDKFGVGKKFCGFKLVTSFFWAFFRAYILNRLFLTGYSGFIHSMTIGFYAFLKEAKLYELKIKSNTKD